MSKDMGNLNVEELLAKMAQETGSEPKPMKYLAQLRPEMVLEHARSKQFAASGQAIPEKYKALISFAVAAALGSESCTLTQAKIARRKGATAEEIIEALITARFTTSSTIFSTAVNALEMLAGEK
ncbi:carboxymuconolactone decarboxylase family protein [Neomoorella humiferrea]|uniref:Carboxymuconolactone decarboxylase family protein n=1 Tax=Neomoorella humiferrea TaxID=676965 RepID=A0A2T0ARZ0_9FIRM|nr:carboxymuconolactone decarboxylase family protein [Moorella humiferrea]PRR72566.1 Carboxymuconolactone decarboxylase family protein [Moorella humiferrea]